MRDFLLFRDIMGANQSYDEEITCEGSKGTHPAKNQKTDGQQKSREDKQHKTSENGVRKNKGEKS